MVTMTYTGKHRTVRRGPNLYDLKRGTFEVPRQDVAFLTGLGARVKDDDTDDPGDTPGDDESTDTKG